jgi:hypothetical protein
MIGLALGGVVGLLAWIAPPAWEPDVSVPAGSSAADERPTVAHLRLEARSSDGGRVVGGG